MLLIHIKVLARSPQTIYFTNLMVVGLVHPEKVGLAGDVVALVAGVGVLVVPLPLQLLQPLEAGLANVSSRIVGIFGRFFVLITIAVSVLK